MQTKIFILIGALFLIVLGFSLPLIGNWLFWFAIFFLSMVGLLLIGIIVLTYQTHREKLLDIRATRKQKEYITKEDGHGMLHLINVVTGHTQNLTIDTRAYRNGHYELPTATELQLGTLVLSRNKDIPLKASQMLLDAPEKDLLTLIDEYPHCLIYGGTGGGKTSLLRTIAHRRKLAGHQVLILDSHEHPSKWTGLDRMETPDKINEAIAILFKILTQNIEALRDGRATEQDFKKITIITDEWTEIVHNSELAGEFISTMVRQSRKYGLSLIFATQTNLASDLGLDGRYKTINGFLQLRLSKANNNYTAFAHTSSEKLGEYQVPNPLPLPELLPTGYIAPSLETTIPDIEKPSDEEQQVLSLLQQGKSYRYISKALWDSHGTFYNNKIDKIVEKWGESETE